VVDARSRLVRQLQLAHAGEKAAAIAYSGHWKSVRDPQQRAAIQKIEAEEWDHRARLHRMLTALGARPAGLREAWMSVIGRVIWIICFVTGWFIPMYGAGKIERRNVHEYADAARFAKEAGHPELVDELLCMAEVEWEHEAYFRGLIAGHWMLRVLPLWPALPPRDELR
jgi:hypothetical protein